MDYSHASWYFSLLRVKCDLWQPPCCAPPPWGWQVRMTFTFLSPIFYSSLCWFLICMAPFKPSYSDLPFQCHKKKKKKRPLYKHQFFLKKCVHFSLLYFSRWNPLRLRQDGYWEVPASIRAIQLQYKCIFLPCFHAGLERFAPMSVALKPNANHICISSCSAVASD